VAKTNFLNIFSPPPLRSDPPLLPVMVPISILCAYRVFKRDSAATIRPKSQNSEGKLYKFSSPFCDQGKIMMGET